MQRKFLPLALVLLVAGLFLWWWMLPANVLKRRVASLLETAEVPPGMSDIARGARGPNLARYLDRKVRIVRPDDLRDEIPEAMERDTIAAYYSAGARSCSRIEFEQPEFDEILVKGDEAHVKFRVDAVAEFPSRRPADGIQVVETSWRKVDGDWLMTEVKWQETGRN